MTGGVPQKKSRDVNKRRPPDRRAASSREERPPNFVLTMIFDYAACATLDSQNTGNLKNDVCR